MPAVHPLAKRASLPAHDRYDVRRFERFGRRRHTQFCRPERRLPTKNAWVRAMDRGSLARAAAAPNGARIAHRVSRPIRTRDLAWPDSAREAAPLGPGPTEDGR